MEPDNGETRTRFTVAASTAAVAGAFCLVVSAIMAWEVLRHDKADPWDSPEFKALKTRAKAAGADEELRERLRREDLRLREAFFGRAEFLRRGKYMLLGGVLVLLIAGKVAVDAARAPPHPGAPRRDGDAWRRASRRRIIATAAMAVVVFGAAMGAVFLTADPLNAARRLAELRAGPDAGPPADADAPAPPADPTRLPPPSPDVVALNWPRFRGPEGRGVSAYANVPTSWNGSTGENILWTSEPIPLPGQSSPIVWDDRVFVTGASAERRELYCYHADTGELLWRRSVAPPDSPAAPPEVMEDTGYAAPTPVTDGRAVMAIFANGDAASFTLDGRTLWAKNLGVPESMYGYASSPAVWRGRALIQYDQGSDPAAMKSEATAIDLVSGEILWIKGREVVNSWSSPIVASTPSGPQFITTSSPWVISYRPSDGEELWRANVLSGDVGPSPVCVGGVAYTVTAYSQLSAVETDGSGDVTESHVLWTAELDLPDIVSPLVEGGTVKMLTTYGMLTCRDAKTGELIYDHEYEKTFRGSPTLVGDAVYIPAADGTMILIAAGREYRELGRCELGEKTNCSPAFLDGRIYIRGAKHLWCIAKTEE